MAQPLSAIATDLRERGGADIEETFHDDSFGSAQKRGLCLGKARRGTDAQIITIANRHGLPVAVCIQRASPRELMLVEKSL